MRRRVVIVWVALLALIAGVVAHERTSLFAPAPPEQTGRQPLFGFSENELGSVEVIRKGELAAVMRAPDGQWFRHDASHRHSGASAPATAGGDDTHQADPVLSATLAEQLSVIARTKADRQVLPDRGLEEYGLANPPVMIAFYGRGEDGPDYSKPLDVLYVGDLLSTQFAFYAMREGDRELSLVPRYFVVPLIATLYGEEEPSIPIAPIPTTPEQ